MFRKTNCVFVNTEASRCWSSDDDAGAAARTLILQKKRRATLTQDQRPQTISRVSDQDLCGCEGAGGSKRHTALVKIIFFFGRIQKIVHLKPLSSVGKGTWLVFALELHELNLMIMFSTTWDDKDLQWKNNIRVSVQTVTWSITDKFTVLCSHFSCLL